MSLLVGFGISEKPNIKEKMGDVCVLWRDHKTLLCILILIQDIS